MHIARGHRDQRHISGLPPSFNACPEYPGTGRAAFDITDVSPGDTAWSSPNPLSAPRYRGGRGVAEPDDVEVSLLSEDLGGMLAGGGPARREVCC